jgi:hypothetical protein
MSLIVYNPHERCSEIFRSRPVVGKNVAFGNNISLAIIWSNVCSCESHLMKLPVIVNRVLSLVQNSSLCYGAVNIQINAMI